MMSFSSEEDIGANFALIFTTVIFLNINIPALPFVTWTIRPADWTANASQQERDLISVDSPAHG